MMGQTRPLDSFPLVRTRNMEEMRVSLARIYAEPKMDFVNRDTVLRAVINSYRLRHIGLSYLSYGANIRLQYPATNFISQIFPIAGKSEILIEDRSIIIDRDHSAIISADVAVVMKSYAEYERLLLTVDAAALMAKLSAIVGTEIRSPLKMNPSQNFVHPSARILRDNFIFLVNNLGAAAPLPPLLLAEFEQALMVMFLHANQHNYSHLLEQEPADAASWQVRRAEEYIEANWDKPISLEAIATVSGVSIHSLLKIFRRSRGCSPMEFVKQVRLRHAGEMLQHPGASTTVSGVAFACGFADLDRFEDDFFRTFGKRPSDMLRGGTRPAPH